MARRPSAASANGDPHVRGVAERRRIRRHRSPPRRTHRLGEPRRPGAALDDGAGPPRGGDQLVRYSRPRRAPPQGPNRAGEALPAGRRRAGGRVSAAQDARQPPDEPAPAAKSACGARQGASRDLRARCRWRQAGHADRPRGRRQDATRAPGRGGAARSVPRRRLLRSARRADRPGAGATGRRADPRRDERRHPNPRGLHRRQGAVAGARQPRAGPRCGAAARRAVLAGRRPQSPRDEPGGPSAQRRIRLPGSAALDRGRGRRAVRRPCASRQPRLRARCERRDRPRALRAARRSPARRRARCGANRDYDPGGDARPSRRPAEAAGRRRP